MRCGVGTPTVQLGKAFQDLTTATVKKGLTNVHVRIASELGMSVREVCLCVCVCGWVGGGYK